MFQLQGLQEQGEAAGLVGPRAGQGAQGTAVSQPQEAGGKASQMDEKQTGTHVRRDRRKRARARSCASGGLSRMHGIERQKM